MEGLIFGILRYVHWGKRGWSVYNQISIVRYLQTADSKSSKKVRKQPGKKVDISCEKFIFVSLPRCCWLPFFTKSH